MDSQFFNLLKKIYTTESEFQISNFKIHLFIRTVKKFTF